MNHTAVYLLLQWIFASKKQGFLLFIYLFSPPGSLFNEEKHNTLKTHVYKLKLFSKESSS